MTFVCHNNMFYENKSIFVKKNLFHPFFSQKTYNLKKKKSHLTMKL